MTSMIHPLGEYMKLPLVRQGVRIRESGTIARAGMELPAGQANRGGEKEDLADALFRIDGRYVVVGEIRWRPATSAARKR